MHKSTSGSVGDNWEGGGQHRGRHSPSVLDPSTGGGEALGNPLISHHYL